METIILKALENDIDAVVEFAASDGGVRVKYSLRAKNGFIYKLIMQSSVKPSNEPVIVDTPDIESGTACGDRTISKSALLLKGYNAGDMDTFSLVCKKNDAYRPVAVGFYRLAWAFDRNVFFNDEPCVDETLKKASEVLGNIKKPVSADSHSYAVDVIANFARSLKPIPVSPLPDFKWYDFICRDYPKDISAFAHITAQIPPDAHMLFGVGKEGLTALALDKKTNLVFNNVSDCITEKNGYYIVGILFMEDGQYFARLD